MINATRLGASNRFALRIAAPLLGATLLSLSATPAHADDSIARAAKGTGCLQYDSLRLRGSETAILTNCDTIAPELGGLRQSMYQHGWLIQNYTAVQGAYDLKDADRRVPQQYAGQRPTFQGTSNIYLTYDLSRVGAFGNNAQFAVQLTWFQNSYRGNGLRSTYVNQLSIEQEFADSRVRLEYGFFTIGAKFYGAILGTSVAASALGPTSNLMYESGIAVGGFKPVPAMDLRLYSPSMRYYNHFGVARSSSPQGFQEDSRQNPSGLSIHVPDAKTLYIDEFGYRLMPKAGQLSSWVRAGGVYNTSDYFNFKEGRPTVSNHMYYLAFTQQYTQPDPNNPVRGLYTDLKLDQVPSTRNAYDKDVLFTLYSIGPFNSRPYDMATLGYQYKRVSRWAQQALHQRTGLTPIESSETVSIGYALHLMRGVYFNHALSYTDHPVLVPKHSPSLVWMSTLYVSL
ncbi:carbohydrate porin [Dyella sp. ASV21]|uniref:carbohydrate porin n=1 Tax=Dyella sp. ASV21 TaxID=2795114 RepID=UPI0018EB7D16|nr:carbohydrate porin [Dyella sp. ASV21]